MSYAAPRLWAAVLAAVTGSVTVGFMPLMARHLYADGLSPASMLFWRYTFALLPLFALTALLRLDFLRALRSGAWRIGAVGATLGAAQTLCFWQSIETLETSIAVLLFYTYPALTLALERLIFKRPIRPRAVLCIGLILGGAALVTGPDLGGAGLDLRGLLWAAPSPVFYAAYLAVTTQLLRGYPPLIGATWLYLGMGATFGITALFLGLGVPDSGPGWSLLLFVGLVPGALTITLFSYSAPRLGPSSYAIIANFELVTVVAVGVLLLGEALTPARAVGGALIVSGIVLHALARQRVDAPEATAPSPYVTERESVTRTG